MSAGWRWICKTGFERKETAPAFPGIRIYDVIEDDSWRIVPFNYDEIDRRQSKLKVIYPHGGAIGFSPWASCFLTTFSFIATY